jgi:hypothetical protein
MDWTQELMGWRMERRREERSRAEPPDILLTVVIGRR